MLVVQVLEPEWPHRHLVAQEPQVSYQPWAEEEGSDRPALSVMLGSGQVPTTKRANGLPLCRNFILSTWLALRG